MRKTNWHGCIVVPMTPFDEDDKIDTEVFRDELQFSMEAGATGFCLPIMGSEFHVLSESERQELVRIAIDEARGRVPVIANCAATSIPLAVRYAKEAEDMGADGLIAMPPYLGQPDFAKIYEYFGAIAHAVSLPIMIQNHSCAPLTADQLVKVASDFGNITWVKQEVNPSPKTTAELRDKDCQAIEGLMGGNSGRYLITEMDRGAKGFIITPYVVDIMQNIWELWNSGQHTEAEDLYQIVLPVLVAEDALGWLGVSKEFLVRRGVFKNNRNRSCANPLSEYDMREIDRVYHRVKPYFKL
jgi:4-hydroxy-tetrahydrodipicolinate synthase